MRRLVLLLLLPAAGALAHPPLEDARRIAFPDVDGALTLVCDLHTHTVFSDGWVWPTLRVKEAARDGVDCLSVTEHLEWQPHAADIPHPDRDRAFAVASEAAEAKSGDVLVIRGSEITRKMPPGHANAVFITDSNKLLSKQRRTGRAKEPKDLPVRAVFEEAAAQGGFVFWNHPHWWAQRSDGVAKLDPIHEELIRDGLLHGIEVINDVTFSDEALAIALEHDLTILATSDIHDLIDWRYDVPGGGHRPVTLVFAPEKTPEALHAALTERRTVGWFGNTLVGREDVLMPLLRASLVVTGAAYRAKTTVLEVTLENRSDARFVLRSLGDHRFHEDIDVLEVDPHATRTLRVKTIEAVAETTLTFEVLNAITAPDTHPTLSLAVPVAAQDPPE